MRHMGWMPLRHVSKCQPVLKTCKLNAMKMVYCPSSSHIPLIIMIITTDETSLVSKVLARPDASEGTGQALPDNSARLLLRNLKLVTILYGGYVGSVVSCHVLQGFRGIYRA